MKSLNNDSLPVTLVRLIGGVWVFAFSKCSLAKPLFLGTTLKTSLMQSSIPKLFTPVRGKNNIDNNKNDNNDNKSDTKA